MKLWKLTYELKDEFSSPVTRHSYSLRCFPRDMISQKVQSCQCKVLPCSGNSRGRDSFGNPLLTGCFETAHTEFKVQLEATVLTDGSLEPERKESSQLGMFRYMTEYTNMGETLKEFYKKLTPVTDRDPWKRAAQMMNMLYGSFQYVSGSTDFYTTAEEAFSQGTGVCQDYAHILLSLCRQEQMTVRYVAGAIPGEGETHAWIEVLKDGYWKGFDPTHNREADEEYIRFAVGRDAHDCCLNRGVFLGNAFQQQEVHVKMEECELDKDNCIHIPAGDGDAGN